MLVGVMVQPGCQSCPKAVQIEALKMLVGPFSTAEAGRFDGGTPRLAAD